MASVAINQVKIHTNRRPLKDHKVSELMQSIQANGLLNPITLDQNFNLIAGLHRLTACKLLGFEQIECSIVNYKDADQSRLAEIDENLIRNELEALERAELWLERDQILERMGLRAKPGDNQYSRRGGETNSPPVKTTVELAREAGFNERTFQLGKQIASGILPEVKEVIRGTPIAKSPSALLKVARAGSKERHLVKTPEIAIVPTEARAKQRELQLAALNSLTAAKAAKQATKPRRSRSTEVSNRSDHRAPSRPGDEWVLDHHLLYCGDTATEDFIDRLPSDAALAVVSLTGDWEYDYLLNEAHVVAVICREGGVHRFCRQHHLPFQYEWLLDNLYVAVLAQQPLLTPEKPADLGGIEGMIAYLVNLYTKPGNFVIAPLLGHGETLITCERTGRICFAGDPSPERVDRSIDRWQNWTGKAVERMETVAG